MDSLKEKVVDFFNGTATVETTQIDMETTFTNMLDEFEVDFKDDFLTNVRVL